MTLRWNDVKNEMLKQDRGVAFERIVVAVEEGHLIDIIEHPNRDKYKNQLIFIVDLDGYAYCVPCVEEPDGGFFLKTIFPSRKYTREYNLEGKDD
jgi:hypothetical protein